MAIRLAVELVGDTPESVDTASRLPRSPVGRFALPRVLARVLPALAAAAVAMAFLAISFVEFRSAVQELTAFETPPNYLAGLGKEPEPAGFAAAADTIATYEMNGRVEVFGLGAGGDALLETGATVSDIAVSAEAVVAAHREVSTITVYLRKSEEIEEVALDDQPISIALDGLRLVVGDDAGQLVVLDLQTGDRSLIELGGIGVDVSVVGDVATYVDGLHDRAVVVNLGSRSAWEIDAPSGVRQVVVEGGLAHVLSVLEPAVSSYDIATHKLVFRQAIAGAPTAFAVRGRVVRHRRWGNRDG